jgi:hypothetical protein
VSRLATALVAIACVAGSAPIAAPAAPIGSGWAPAKAGTDVPKPRIDWDPIPFGKDRKRQTASYSHRHYGKRTWRLRDPRVIVLHYTATATYGPVHNTFAANAPALGERPGVCAQFVVAKDGTIHQLTRLGARCRHTIGLNHTAIGIEMVQRAKPGRHASERAILRRHDQIRAATRLTAWLKQRYRIRMRDVIGHAMANDSRHFKDLEGWRNDHVDWRKADVRDFRRIVSRVIRGHR